MNQTLATEGSLYGIGTAATMSGLSVHTIRVWERRYNAVTPLRTDGGRRRYSPDDVDRLSLLKRLTDLGEAIGAIAPLDDAMLQERLDHCRQKQRESGGTGVGPIRLAVLGVAADRLVARLARQLGDMSCITATASVEEFRADVRLGEPNVLLLDYPAIDERSLAEVVALAAEQSDAICVLLYRFAASGDIHRLEEQGVVALRGPADDTDLLRAISLVPVSRQHGRAAKARRTRPAGSTVDMSVRTRLFSDQQLGRIADASNSIQCECPAHLVDLVRSLSAFEAYSAQCESRNPQDEELHRYLHAQTSQARSLIEMTIDHLVEVEGIDLQSSGRRDG